MTPMSGAPHKQAGRLAACAPEWLERQQCFRDVDLEIKAVDTSGFALQLTKIGLNRSADYRSLMPGLMETAAAENRQKDRQDAAPHDQS
jgi:hypothetical protein